MLLATFAKYTYIANCALIKLSVWLLQMNAASQSKWLGTKRLPAWQNLWRVTCWSSETESRRWCLRWREASHRRGGRPSIKSPAARYNSSFLAQRSASVCCNCKSCNSSQDQASFSSSKFSYPKPPVSIWPHEQHPDHLLFPSSCFSLCRSAIIGMPFKKPHFKGRGGTHVVWPLSTSGPFMDI